LGEVNGTGEPLFLGFFFVCARHGNYLGCGAGEKPEITSNAYLLLTITEDQLNDQAIALFINYNNVRTRTKGSESYLIEQALIMNLKTGFH
jgi:hypothetical protein